MTDSDWNKVVVEWNDIVDGYGPQGEDEYGTTNPFDEKDNLTEIFRRFCKKCICYFVN